MPQPFYTPFYGDSLTPDDCEAIVFAKIPVEVRVPEAEVMSQRWFDYRRMHPVHATYLWAHLYTGAVRDAYAKTKDRDGAATLQVLPAEDVFQTPFAVACWTARQRFDSIGVRYDFALRFCMNRFADRGWNVFPRPNQLYGEELILDIADAWKIECRASLQIAKDVRFRNDHFVGAPEQVAYREWLMDQVRQRCAIPAESYRPLSRLFSEKVLLPEHALPVFGDKAVRKAMMIAT